MELVGDDLDYAPNACFLGSLYSMHASETADIPCRLDSSHLWHMKVSGSAMFDWRTTRLCALAQGTSKCTTARKSLEVHG